MGELRCLDARTGDRVWQCDAAVGGNLGLFGHAFLIQHEDRTFIWNDQGELILTRLTPRGCETISRAKLLDTSERTRGRDILWCHPAFANRCLYVHNGKELICVSLAAPSPAQRQAHAGSPRSKFLSVNARSECPAAPRPSAKSDRELASIAAVLILGPAGSLRGSGGGVDGTVG
jgi:hypothetical protein